MLGIGRLLSMLGPLSPNRMWWLFELFCALELNIDVRTHRE